MRKILESLKRKIPQAGSFALDLVFPKRCVSCGRQGDWLCQACAAAVLFRPDQDCLVCGRPNDDGSPCPPCRPLTGLKRLLAAHTYRQAEAAALAKLVKYRFVRSAGPKLGELLLDYFIAAGAADGLPKKLLVLPVPLHPRRRRWRGFNQAEFLARPLAERFGWQYEPAALKRRGYARAQASLSWAERQRDLAACFVVPPQFQPVVNQRKILLVDDVVTSGATMEACAKALRQAGARAVYGATLLRG